MSATVSIIKNARVWWDWIDLSGIENECSLVATVDELVFDPFNQGAHCFKPGLLKFQLRHKGYVAFDEDAVDEEVWARRGTGNIPLTISMPGEIGDRAYFCKSGQAEYKVSLPVGQLPSMELSMTQSAAPMVRGALLDNAQTYRAGTGHTDGENLGAVASGDTLYAILHIAEAAGSGSIEVIVQSAPTADFADPTDLFTFTAATAAGSEWAVPVAGPITDEYYRVLWHVGMMTLAKFAVAVGSEPSA